MTALFQKAQSFAHNVFGTSLYEGGDPLHEDPDFSAVEGDENEAGTDLTSEGFNEDDSAFPDEPSSPRIIEQFPFDTNDDLTAHCMSQVYTLGFVLQLPKAVIRNAMKDVPIWIKQVHFPDIGQLLYTCLSRAADDFGISLTDDQIAIIRGERPDDVYQAVAEAGDISQKERDLLERTSKRYGSIDGANLDPNTRVYEDELASLLSESMDLETPSSALHPRIDVLPGGPPSAAPVAAEAGDSDDESLVSSLDSAQELDKEDQNSEGRYTSSASSDGYDLDALEDGFDKQVEEGLARFRDEDDFDDDEEPNAEDLFRPPPVFHSAKNHHLYDFGKHEEDLNGHASSSSLSTRRSSINARSGSTRSTSYTPVNSPAVSRFPNQGPRRSHTTNYDSVFAPSNSWYDRRPSGVLGAAAPLFGREAAYEPYGDGFGTPNSLRGGTLQDWDDEGRTIAYPAPDFKRAADTWSLPTRTSSLSGQPPTANTSRPSWSSTPSQGSTKVRWSRDQSTFFDQFEEPSVIQPASPPRRRISSSPSILKQTPSPDQGAFTKPRTNESTSPVSPKAQPQLRRSGRQRNSRRPLDSPKPEVLSRYRGAAPLGQVSHEPELYNDTSSTDENLLEESLSDGDSLDEAFLDTSSLDQSDPDDRPSEETDRDLPRPRTFRSLSSSVIERPTLYARRRRIPTPERTYRHTSPEGASSPEISPWLRKTPWRRRFGEPDTVYKPERPTPPTTPVATPGRKRKQRGKSQNGPRAPVGTASKKRKVTRDRIGRDVSCKDRAEALNIDSHLVFKPPAESDEDNALWPPTSVARSNDPHPRDIALTAVDSLRATRARGQGQDTRSQDPHKSLSQLQGATTAKAAHDGLREKASAGEKALLKPTTRRASALGTPSRGRRVLRSGRSYNLTGTSAKRMLEAIVENSDFLDSQDEENLRGGLYDDNRRAATLVEKLEARKRERKRRSTSPPPERNLVEKNNQARRDSLGKKMFEDNQNRADQEA